MKGLVIATVLVLGLAACESTDRVGTSRTASAPQDTPSTGVRISGYARFGVNWEDR